MTKFGPLMVPTSATGASTMAENFLENKWSDVDKWVYSILSQVACGVSGKLDPPCNAVGYIDRQVLGLNHMYQHPAWKRSKVCSCSLFYTLIQTTSLAVAFQLIFSKLKLCRLVLVTPHMRGLSEVVLLHGAMLLLNRKEF